MHLVPDSEREVTQHDELTVMAQLVIVAHPLEVVLQLIAMLLHRLVVVAIDEELLAVQARQQIVDLVWVGLEGEVAEVVDLVFWLDGLVPATDELFIHLVDVAAELLAVRLELVQDVVVPEVIVGGEVDHSGGGTLGSIGWKSW